MTNDEAEYEIWWLFYCFAGMLFAINVGKFGIAAHFHNHVTQLSNPRD